MFFLLLVSILFSRTPYLPYWGGGNDGRGEIKKASACIPSADEQDKDVVLVHTVQLKQIINRNLMMNDF